MDHIIRDFNGPSIDNLTDYQKAVFKALGYENAPDFDTGTSYWKDDLSDSGTGGRIKTPGDQSLNDIFRNQLAGFQNDSLGRSRYGSAGYIDPGPRLPNGLGGVDPSVADAFKDQINLNGKDYWRAGALGGATYDELNNDPNGLSSRLMKAYGVTPNDFSYDPKYGNMLEQNDRTTAATKKYYELMDEKKNGTFNDSLTSWLSAVGMFAGPVLGAAGAAAGMSEGAIGAMQTIPKLATGAVNAAGGNYTGLLGSLGSMLGGGSLSGVGNNLSDFGKWLGSFFGGDGATGATASSAGGSVGGGFGGGMGDEFNFDDFFGDGANEPINSGGQWWSNDPVPGQDNSGNDPLSREDAGIGNGMTSGFDFSKVINDAGNATGQSGLLEKALKLLFGAGAGGAAAGSGGGGGGNGSGGGNGGLLGSLFGNGGGSAGNNGILGLLASMMQSGALGQAADKYAQAGVEAARLSDPFRDQRPQYQQMLSQSYNDPNYFQNNPTFRGIADMAGRQAQATAASQGYNMSGNAPIEVGKAINDAGLKYALPFQAQLGQNAGAGINPGYSGFLSQQGANMATQANLGQKGANMNGIAQGAGLLGQLGNMFV